MFRLGYSKNYIPYIILIILDTLLTNVSVTNFADLEKSCVQNEFRSLMLDDSPYQDLVKSKAQKPRAISDETYTTTVSVNNMSYDISMTSFLNNLLIFQVDTDQV